MTIPYPWTKPHVTASLTSCKLFLLRAWSPAARCCKMSTGGSWCWVPGRQAVLYGNSYLTEAEIKGKYNNLRVFGLLLVSVSLDHLPVRPYPVMLCPRAVAGMSPDVVKFCLLLFILYLSTLWHLCFHFSVWVPFSHDWTITCWPVKLPVYSPVTYAGDCGKQNDRICILYSECPLLLEIKISLTWIAGSLSLVIKLLFHTRKKLSCCASHRDFRETSTFSLKRAYWLVLLIGKSPRRDEILEFWKV